MTQSRTLHSRRRPCRPRPPRHRRPVAAAGLVAGEGEDGGDLVVLVGLVDVDAVLGDVDDAGLQRGVDAAEGHVDVVDAVGGEDVVFRGGCRDA